ncbi:MAG: hypothetical protein AMJ75_03240 [Phycisphaerae bacterium SM1_79]|nr:MAG: hypothetical protein AMJ75_03240 [Phycisphaerae bacterium SM1_79]
MKRIKLFYVIIAIPLLLILAAALFLKWRTPVSETASLTVLDPCELRLTLAWNGETIHAAAPATLPRSILDSEQYERWQRAGNVTELVGVDAQGNKVLAEALGFVVDAKGTRRPLVPSIKVFSPDGQLLNKTSYSPDGLPQIWTVYDATGKKLQEVWYRLHGKPGTPFLREVTFFNPDGTGRRYVVNNPDQIAWVEWQVDSQGNIQRVVNGGRPELVDTFKKGPPEQKPPPPSHSAGTP